jgi:hypothetical protein
MKRRRCRAPEGHTHGMWLAPHLGRPIRPVCIRGVCEDRKEMPATETNGRMGSRRQTRPAGSRMGGRLAQCLRDLPHSGRVDGLLRMQEQFSSLRDERWRGVVLALRGQLLHISVGVSAAQ